jgi:hypothetical protein
VEEKVHKIALILCQLEVKWVLAGSKYALVATIFAKYDWISQHLLSMDQAHVMRIFVKM